MNWVHRHYCRSHHWASTVGRLIPWAIHGVDLGDRTLDLGSGPGFGTRLLGDRAKYVVAIDISCRPLAAIRRAPNVGVVCADASSLPFASGAFTAVVACAMLHHVPTAALQQAVFREIVRALRPGGVFVAVEPHFTLSLHLFHLGDRYAPLTPDTARLQLISAGFRDIVVETRGRYFRIGARRD
jgi:SAM-dependent methyltransferase